MSSAPNPSSQPSKSASSPQLRTEAQANSAPEPSSPAETMTDKPSSLATPPTRMIPPEDAPVQTDTAATAEPAPAQAASTPTPDQPTEPAAPTAAEPSTSAPVDTPVDTSVQSSAATPADSAASTSPSAASSQAASASQSTSQPAPSLRQQPIPPASEPMQYRAIGLVRGKYTPSAEQFTRGCIVTDDGVLIDAVLLGRVMSLVKKHIELEESHLWVVYPRTREKDLELHMQIVGVWEPEKLNRSTDLNIEDAEDADSEDDEDDGDSTPVDALDATAESEAESESDSSEDTAEEPLAEAANLVGTALEVNPSPDATPESSSASVAASPVESTAGYEAEAELDDRYFSVRGEVVYQSDEERRLLVKIRRAPKPGTTQSKVFKVALVGTLEGKALGYFWDFEVQRENSDLVMKSSTKIGIVPPQKRSADGGGRPRHGGRPRSGPPGPPRKRWSNNRDGGRDTGRPQRSERGERSNTPSTPRQPIAKPVKRRPSQDQD